VLVGTRQLHLGHLVVRLEHGLAHLEDRLLQGQGVHGGERREQHLPDAGVAAVVVDVRVGVAPGGGEARGQDPVVGLRERRVAVAREAVELRAGRLEHHAVLQPADHEDFVPVHLYDGRAGLRTLADERVVVRDAVDVDPLPGVLLRRPATAGHPGELGHEVPPQRDQELLGGVHAVLAGERVDGVLLSVGGDHVAVVAGGVGGREVTAQL
jgi:hypothetical protein